MKIKLLTVSMCLLLVGCVQVQKPAPLVITTATLPQAEVGHAYSEQLLATGGSPPYKWSIVPNTGQLPIGVTLNPNGLISGTPAANGQFRFTVEVTDSLQNTQHLAMR